MSSIGYIESYSPKNIIEIDDLWEAHIIIGDKWGRIPRVRLWWNLIIKIDVNRCLNETLFDYSEGIHKRGCYRWNKN